MCEKEGGPSGSGGGWPGWVVWVGREGGQVHSPGRVFLKNLDSSHPCDLESILL